MPLLPGSGRRFGFFPGSTIGNLRPVEAAGFLGHCRDLLGFGGAMLVGVDTRKDASVLHAAYDDAAGVTAQFTLNILARANRELGADFDLGGFAHEATYDAVSGRVAIHLRSLACQTATIAGRRFGFAEGERVHVEDSFKYAPHEFAELARSAGFRPEACWTDDARMFSVHYLAVA
jgi:uncharacterized SAM-dependent methyltransferase